TQLSTPSLHDALPISPGREPGPPAARLLLCPLRIEGRRFPARHDRPTPLSGPTVRHAHHPRLPRPLLEPRPVSGSRPERGHPARSEEHTSELQSPCNL